MLPNQELYMLYGTGALSINGDNYSCIFPICSAKTYYEIWHACNEIQGKIGPICRTSDLQGEKSLCAERNGCFPY